jgi:hypothetical protein
MAKDMFFKYEESQAQVGYRSAVVYKEQGDNKYRFLCASETVPFPFGTRDTFEYDLLNSASKGMVEGKSTLEQSEIELLYTRNNAMLFEKLKGRVLDFMSLTPQGVGYKYHGTISFRPNEATADIHRGTYTITPMGASEVPIWLAKQECYEPLFFADVIPDEISIADLDSEATGVEINVGIAGNPSGVITYKYDTISYLTNKETGTKTTVSTVQGKPNVISLPKEANLYVIYAEISGSDTYSPCFTTVNVTT